MLVNRNDRVAAGVFGLIRRLLSTGVKATPSPAPLNKEDPLYRKLSALGRNKEKVADTISEYVSEGGYVDKFQLLSCVRELRRYKRHEHALQIIDWMEEQNRLFNFGYKEHALRMELITKVKGIDAAENYFNSLPPSAKNHCTHGTLLFCYCQANMVDKALGMFVRMDNMNMIDGSLPFSNLMSLYMKTEQPDKVPPLIEEMKNRNIQPNLYAYNLLMHSYSCLNDIEGVERVFEEMKRDNKKLCRNWTTYSNLAILYIRAGQQGKAEAALKKLEEEMDYNNREAYHFLISLYAKIYDLQKVHRIWKSLKSNFKQVTNMSYLIMLQALRKLKDVNGMKKCYEQWESAHLCFDIRLANTVIGAYLMHNKPEEAEAIFRSVLEKSQGPFFEACEFFMAYYLKKHQINQALQYLEVATSKNRYQNWQPKKDTINGFLKYFKKDYDVTNAEKFCSLVKKINCVDGKLYESLLQKVSNIEAVVEDSGQCLQNKQGA